MDKLPTGTGNGQRKIEEALFVGCDIGSSNHAAAIMDSSGTVLEKLPKVFNTLKGFMFLDKKIAYWKIRIGATTVRFGFEPTGHYWKPLVHFMCNREIEVFFIKTTAVKAMRELTDSTQSKNDKRDAITLAHLLRGKSSKEPAGRGHLARASRSRKALPRAL